jgi:hypothetical protein
VVREWDIDRFGLWSRVVLGSLVWDLLLFIGSRIKANNIVLSNRFTPYG